MSAIDKLAKLVAGFRAPFTAVREDALGLSLLTDDDGDEALIATFECDDRVAVAFVDLLNTIAPALTEVAALRAEIARLIAVPPDVEAAIESFGDICYERGHVHAGGDSSGRSTDREAAERDLRAALARRETAASPPTDAPAPCAHLDRAHDGSCFGCGRGANNTNPEATP